MEEVVNLNTNYDLAVKDILRVIKLKDGYGKEKGKPAVIANAVVDAIASCQYFKAWNGALMCYTGKKWVRVAIKDELPKIIYKVLREKDVGIGFQTPSVVGMVTGITEGKAETYIPMYRGDKKYIAFKNCVLDMVTRDKLEFSPKYETVISLDVEYDPDAKCPLWDKTLKENIKTNEEIAVLHEFLGLALIDRRNLNPEKMLWLIGQGGNGKSVVSEAVSDIFGESCSGMEFEQFCTAPDAMYHRAMLAGKLINFCKDMGVKEFSNGIFKSIVSGEEIQCRPIHEKPFSTKDMPLLAANINKMPVVTDSSNAFWRRGLFIEFPFTRAAKDQDKMLKFKLQAELSGIFNRILEGRDRLVRNNGNFTDSEAMDKLKERVKIESNSVLGWCNDKGYRSKRWVSDAVDRSELKWEDVDEMKVFSRELMQSYSTYCDENNNHAKNRANFNEDLKSEGFEYKEKMRLSGIVSTGFVFYKIKEEVLVKEEEENLPF